MTASTKCETCGFNPCKPWSNLHDEDFRKEIDNSVKYCESCDMKGHTINTHKALKVSTELPSELDSFTCKECEKYVIGNIFDGLCRTCKDKTHKIFQNDELKYIRFVMRINIKANGLCEMDKIIFDKISILLNEMTQEEVDMKNEY